MINDDIPLDTAHCSICTHVDRVQHADCDRYLFEFLLQLSNKLDDPSSIDEHFVRSIFIDDKHIDRMSCTGLTLMHVNVLGGE
jgi:hypothetical protein